MKQYIILLTLAVCISTYSYAQHLSVKGIEINGSPATFVAKLKQKGFTVVPDIASDGQTALKGSFAGYKDSYIIIEHSNGNVSRAMVFLEAAPQWVNAKDMYKNLKSSYQEKYKVTPKSEEYFDNPDEETTGSAHIALENQRAKYESTFKVDNGKIIIDIAHVNVLQGNLLWGGVGLNGTYIIRIDYIDNTNYELQRKADLEDL